MHGTLATGTGVTGSGQTLTVQVADVRAEACDVMTLELRAIGPEQLPPFDPGAHIGVHLPNGLLRHYSLTNDWRERDRYVIGVGRASGSRGGSAFVHSGVRAGMQLRIGAPKNNFPIDPEAGRHLFIAGGIGITPIVAMIRWCVAKEKPWRLVYAARSRQRAAFYEQLCVLAKDCAHFHFDDESGGVLDVAQAVASLAPEERIYCCGPALLMEAVKSATEHLPGGTVRFEVFTAPEPDPNLESDSFSVRLERSGAEFIVPPDKSILEVLEENGIEIPFSCREGLCGTCVTPVCSGEPDHRDYVLTDEQRASGKLMTICCSRSRSASLTLDL